MDIGCWDVKIRWVVERNAGANGVHLGTVKNGVAHSNKILDKLNVHVYDGAASSRKKNP